MEQYESDMDAIDINTSPSPTLPQDGTPSTFFGPEPLVHVYGPPLPPGHSQTPDLSFCPPVDTPDPAKHDLEVGCCYNSGVVAISS